MMAWVCDGGNSDDSGDGGDGKDNSGDDGHHNYRASHKRRRGHGGKRVRFTLHITTERPTSAGRTCSKAMPFILQTPNTVTLYAV